MVESSSQRKVSYGLLPVIRFDRYVNPDPDTALRMHGLVRRCVGGRVEPDCGDAGHAAPDEIVRLVLELVEPADRHRRIAGYGGFHAEPVPDPAHPDGLDLVDTGYGSDGMFGAVDQGRVDAV